MSKSNCIPLSLGFNAVNMMEDPDENDDATLADVASSPQAAGPETTDCSPAFSKSINSGVPVRKSSVIA